MSKPFRYAAFISYRHVEPDRGWAKWLHRAIETYRIPAQLISADSSRKTIGRVFRDEEELSASASLSEKIDEALRDSEFLVVICSPRTPGSQWCNREIERFRELGRGDRILALLIEGEPADSFPAALRQIRSSVIREDGSKVEHISQSEPLAADVRPASDGSRGHISRSAKLRLISTLLGVRYDDLVNRDQQRRIRRLAAATSVACIIMLGMIGLAAFAVIQRIDAVRQRDLAEQRLVESERARSQAQAVSDFLINDVLAAINPTQIPIAIVREAIMKAVIDPAAATVHGRFGEQPLVEAAVRDILGLAYSRVGKANLGLAHSERAVELRRTHLGPDHPETIAAMFNLGWAQELCGKTDLAEKTYKATMDAELRIGADRRPAIRAVNQYASLLHYLQRSKEAEPLARDCLARARRVLGEDSMLTLNIAAGYAAILSAIDRKAEAIPLYRDVYDRTRRVLGENHPDTITAATHAGMVLLFENKLTEAEPLFKDVLERSERVLGREHFASMQATAAYAGVMAAMGKNDEADQLYVDAINRMLDDPMLGDDHPETRIALESYLNFLQHTGREKEAAELAKEYDMPLPTTQPATQPN